MNQRESFLQILDEMIDSAEEFIRDDGPIVAHSSVKDIEHLEYVKKLFEQSYQDGAWGEDLS